MKPSLKKRIIRFELSSPSGKKHRVAKILCDSDAMYSSDFSEIDAEVLLIIPDNGHRTIGDKEVPKGSYRVTYL